jgi:hypothetical protein
VNTPRITSSEIASSIVVSVDDSPGESIMNVWKPIALCAFGALAISVGTQVAHADGGACHNQANMQSALEHFRQARASLDRAEHNKGGWRDRAIQAADNAIRETSAGCAFADTH